MSEGKMRGSMERKWRRVRMLRSLAGPQQEEMAEDLEAVSKVTSRSRYVHSRARANDGRRL